MECACLTCSKMKSEYLEFTASQTYDRITDRIRMRVKDESSHSLIIGRPGKELIFILR
jgi:hypothetical protein